MRTLETIDLANVTGGITGNDGGCCPPWPRPTGPRDPLGPRNPIGPRDPLGPRNPLGPVTDPAGPR
jgi:hypothetical protein